MSSLLKKELASAVEQFFLGSLAAYLEVEGRGWESKPAPDKS